MSEWRDISSAPRDGSPILLALAQPFDSNDVHGYVPWDSTPIVLGWWAGSQTFGNQSGWECCFMYDGAADSLGYSFQFFSHVRPTHWMPLPAPPLTTAPAPATQPEKE